MASKETNEEFLLRLRDQLEGQEVVKVEHDHEDIVLLLSSEEAPVIVILYTRPEAAESFGVQIDGNNADIDTLVSTLEKNVGRESKKVFFESIRKFNCECIDEEGNLHGGLLFDLAVVEAELLPDARRGSLVCISSPSSRILLKDVV